MTAPTFGMSSPRAATSVATNRPVVPFLNFSRASIRAVCERSPCSAPTLYPCRRSIISTRDASFLYNAKTRIRASEAPVWVVFLWASERRWESSRLLKCIQYRKGRELEGDAYSFDRTSSKTSTICSTRLLAVKSSLPTVTRTGSCWKVLARRRTASGHVALTDIGDEYLSITHIRCCSTHTSWFGARSPAWYSR